MNNVEFAIFYFMLSAAIIPLAAKASGMRQRAWVLVGIVSAAINGALFFIPGMDAGSTAPALFFVGSLICFATHFSATVMDDRLWSLLYKLSVALIIAGMALAGHQVYQATGDWFNAGYCLAAVSAIGFFYTRRSVVESYDRFVAWGHKA